MPWGFWSPPPSRCSGKGGSLAMETTGKRCRPQHPSRRCDSTAILLLFPQVPNPFEDRPAPACPPKAPAGPCFFPSRAKRFAREKKFGVLLLMLSWYFTPMEARGGFFSCSLFVHKSTLPPFQACPRFVGVSGDKREGCISVKGGAGGEERTGPTASPGAVAWRWFVGAGKAGACLRIRDSGCRKPDGGTPARGRPHLPPTGSVWLGTLSAVTRPLLFCSAAGSSFGGERAVNSRLLRGGCCRWGPGP